VSSGALQRKHGHPKNSCTYWSTYCPFVRTPKAILHPSWNTRFPITHFIKLRSNPSIVLATQCPCLPIVHIHPIRSITSYLGLLSPSLTPSDVDVNPYYIFRHDHLGRKERHFCVQCQLLENCQKNRFISIPAFVPFNPIQSLVQKCFLLNKCLRFICSRIT